MALYLYEKQLAELAAGRWGTLDRMSDVIRRESAERRQRRYRGGWEEITYIFHSSLTTLTMKMIVIADKNVS